MISSDEWRVRAACRTASIKDLWFPGSSDGSTPNPVTSSRQIAEAKAVCRQCPVAPECLEYSLDNNIADGIWGGLTWKERAPLRGQRQRALADQQVDALTDVEIERVLALADRGRAWNEVERRTGVDRAVCWAVWQRYRPNSPRRGPDAHRGSVDRSEFAS